jgi:hypothetical protein
MPVAAPCCTPPCRRGTALQCPASETPPCWAPSGRAEWPAPPARTGGRQGCHVRPCVRTAVTQASLPAAGPHNPPPRPPGCLRTLGTVHVAFQSSFSTDRQMPPSSCTAAPHHTMQRPCNDTGTRPPPTPAFRRRHSPSRWGGTPWSARPHAPHAHTRAISTRTSPPSPPPPLHHPNHPQPPHQEHHFGGSQRVLGGEVDVHVEAAALEGGAAGPRDGNAPVGHRRLVGRDGDARRGVLVCPRGWAGGQGGVASCGDRRPPATRMRRERGGGDGRARGHGGDVRSARTRSSASCRETRTNADSGPTHTWPLRHAPRFCAPPRATTSPCRALTKVRQFLRDSAGRHGDGLRVSLSRLYARANVPKRLG